MSSRPATTAVPFTEYPVAFGNFDKNRKPVDFIVLHTEAGSKAGTRAHFNNPNSKVSAHYGVNLDGTLDHYLEEFYVAYHCGVEGVAGSYDWNQRSIGIETEDGARPNDVTRTKEQYETLIKLVADICNFYKIPPVLIAATNQRGIIIHRQLNPKKSCPGNLDYQFVISKVAEILNPTPVTQPPLGQGLLTQDEINTLKFLRESWNEWNINNSDKKFDQLEAFSRDITGHYKEREELLKYKSRVQNELSDILLKISALRT